MPASWPHLTAQDGIFDGSKESDFMKKSQLYSFLILTLSLTMGVLIKQPFPISVTFTKAIHVSGKQASKSYFTLRYRLNDIMYWEVNTL